MADLVHSGTNDAELFSFAEFDAESGERTGFSDYSYWGSTFRVFLKNKVAVTLLVLLAALLLFTFIQPFLPGQKSPTEIRPRACRSATWRPARRSGSGRTPSARTSGPGSGAARAPRC
jgi:hypothetical protein